MMVSDKDAPQKLIETVLTLLSDSDKLKTISDNVKGMALNNAVEKIVDRVFEIIERKK